MFVSTCLGFFIDCVDIFLEWKVNRGIALCIVRCGRWSILIKYYLYSSIRRNLMFGGEQFGSNDLIDLKNNYYFLNMSSTYRHWPVSNVCMAKR